MFKVRDIKIQKTITTLFDDFKEFIENRSIDNILRNNYFSKILDLNYKTWIKFKRFPNGSKTETGELIRRDQILICLNEIVEKVTNMLFQERNWIHAYFSKAFFDPFKKHIDEIVQEIEKPENLDDYLELIYGAFYPAFFGNIRKVLIRRDLIFRYFPEEWKITKKRSENNEQIVLKTQKYYKAWALGVMSDLRKLYGREIYDVSKYLLPEVDPYRWSVLLIALFPSWNGNTTRYRAVIERTWDFSKDVENDTKEKEKNTYELAHKLFVNRIGKPKLKNFIKEFKKLEGEYEKDTQEEHHRKELLEIFKRMLKIVNSNQD